MRQRGFDSPEFEAQRHDALLRSVMEIALKTTPGLVGGRDDACP